MKKNNVRWASIEGTDGLEVSNFGDVRSVGGFVYQTFQDKTGYVKVNIKINGVKKQVGVHVLVAKAFVPNPFNKEHVNHKNGDTTNNCEWNLEWNTPYENQMHRRYVLGKDMRGNNNPMFGMKDENNPKFKDWIIALTPDGEVVGRYPTQTKAAIEMFGKACIANQISRVVRHDRNNSLIHGYYFLYEKEYQRMTQADLKPRELLGHPELLEESYYRGQSATKP
jgi:hypothetical protein